MVAEESNMENLEIKLEISSVAADLYAEQDGSFTMGQIAEVLNMNVADIFDHFPNKPAILQFYYLSLLLRYKLMVDEIADFDTYSLSEKLSNFMYASLDLLKEKQEFVQQSYQSLILRSYSETSFEKEAGTIIRSFFREDPNMSASSSLFMNRLFFKLMRKKYLHLVTYWINDDTEGKERTMELIDKGTAFIQEVMYNQVADRGLELFKFLVSNTSCKIPFWDKISSKIEIR